MSELWGPPLWKYLHYNAKFYPKKPTQTDIRNMKTFLRYVGKTLPCQICKKHFDNILRKGGTYNNIQIPPLSDEILSSQRTYFVWMFHVHNYVTIHKKRKIKLRKIKLPKYQDILKHY